MNKKILILVALIATIGGGKLEAQILYVPGGAGGIGNSTTNGNVGIGLNNPTANLVIKCNTNNASNNTMELGAPLIGPNLSHIHWGQTGDWYIRSASTLGNVILQDAGGKVGIGTSSMEEKLHVNGNLFLQATENEGSWARTNLYYSGHHLVIGSKPGVYMHNNLMLRPGGASQGTLVSGLQLFTATGINRQVLKISLSSEGPSYFSNGNIGIGTTDPKNLLDVKGTIHAQEVKVDLTGWADFVFHPSYQLKPLMEVEKFIKANGHLHDIPSAAEVEQNGVNVGEMQKKLLQKVEELTLYVIELKKENEQKDRVLIEQQKQLSELKIKMEQIEKNK